MLDDLAEMYENLTAETTHIANGYIPPPWVELTFIDANTTESFEEIERISHLKRRMKNIPWSDYKIMMKNTEDLLKNAAHLNKRGWDLKPKSEDFKNNIFSSHVEVGNLRHLIEATTSQLLQYGDDLKKVGIKKALKEAKMILKYLKSVNLTHKTQGSQNLLTEAEDYIVWLNAQFDATKPLEELKTNVTNYSKKMDDMRMKIEKTMENLFTYDGLYRQINGTYAVVRNQTDNIYILNADSVGTIDEGLKLNEEASGFIIDSQNNFQVN